MSTLFRRRYNLRELPSTRLQMNAIRSFLALLVFCSTSSSQSNPAYGEHSADVIVYGGTSAAVIAAVQVCKMGHTVILVSPDRHLGGLSSGGLGWTDSGRKEVIGGLARNFYHRIWKEYQRPESWTFQQQEDYGGKGQGTAAVDGGERTMWIFEPHVAEKVFEDLVREYRIPVLRNQWLNRDGGVQLDGHRIVSIETLDGSVFRGQVFIDATYEGDLMAAAGVSFHVGREGKDVYGEEWNGVQTGTLHHGHHFDAIPGKQRISPYIIPGRPDSGVLPHISTEHPGEKHAGDHRLQAYCFRMCLTNVPENRVPFPKPKNYDPKRYELLARVFETGWDEGFRKFDPIPNLKTDTNNHGPMSTDNIGANYDYPTADYERRREIIRDHKEYQQGLMYFVANSPRVPDKIRSRMQQWGLARDEFKDNGNWPHQLYIREARRMVGHFVMTENELLKRKPTPEPVGMGSYTIDSHNVQRYITPEGYVQNEGDIGVGCRPYEIAFGSLLPKKKECENLVVPVCVSSSHIAFGSIRMEPVFMILGQSGATAACMALDRKLAVQDLPYESLEEQLVKDGQVLSWQLVVSGAGIDPRKLPGVVVDDINAEVAGAWGPSTSWKKWLGTGYIHDGDKRDGKSSATFRATLPRAGRYEVRFAYTPNSNRASNALVEVHHLDGVYTTRINQKKVAPIDELFLSMGAFDFGKEGKVVVRNSGADGYVIADGVQFLPK